MKKLIALLLALVLVLGMTACAAKPAEETTQPEQAPAAETSKTAESTEEAPSGAVLTDFDDASLFEYVVAKGEKCDLNDYYNDLGVECDMAIRANGGSVKWLGGGNVPLPTPSKKYTIGFSVYYTVDEVGAMYLEAMKDAAAEIGIELLINDADYDQNLQNQAMEQWILQKVDAVIMTPCDFYACKDGLDALHEAGIPVITLDAPPCAGEVDACVVYDGVEQGRQAGEALEQYLLDNGTEMKGSIYYGTLPFIHPNAVTRELGFKGVFEKYPDIEIKALTGEGPEDHYTAFEGILSADDSILGLWGLYSSATYGIMNVVKASGKTYPITSVDNDRVILEGIYNGEVLGSSCYSAIEGSRLAMMLAVNMLEGQEIPGLVYQTNTMVTKDNVEEMFPVYYGAGRTLADYMAGND